jgi:hypothetical protein
MAYVIDDTAQETSNGSTTFADFWLAMTAGVK